MKTLIRSDSSSMIGHGHIRRDLVFAKTLETEKIFFASQMLDGHCLDMIPYEIILLSSNTSEELIEIIHRFDIDLLVIDHYEITAFDEAKIKQQTGVKMICFDDTYQMHCCDILINPNLYAQKERYASLVPKSCEIRCASPLIRDEFMIEKGKKRQKIYDVCIVMGATDSAHLIPKILKILPSSLHIAIVTTHSNRLIKQLEKEAKKRLFTFLYIDASPIAPILNQSKLIVLTPSTIVQEVLFLGLCFIAIQVSSNQTLMRSYLEDHGYATLRKWNVSSFMQLYNAQ